MTSITKTIQVATPDDTDLEVEIEVDLEWNPGTPGSVSDVQGWEVLNVRLKDEV